MAIFLVVFSLNSTGISFPEARAGQVKIGAGEQTVLLLKLAKTPNKKQREARFADELRLHLDEMKVKELKPEGPAFGEQALSKQIATVRPILEREKALAAIWLVQDAPKLLLLHVVAVSTGRALVRMIETEVESGAEAELAMTTRELLGTAYIFDLDPSEADTPLGKAVETVKNKVAPPEPLPQEPAKVSFLISAAVAGGIAGHKGPSLNAGGEVGLERSIFNGNLSIRGGLGAYGGPLGKKSGLEASGFQIAGLLGILYLWETGPVSLGPFVGLSAGLSHLSLKAGDSKPTAFTEWLVRVNASLEVRIPFTEIMELMIEGGLSGSPKRDIFHKKSDNSVIYASPFLNWYANVGLVIHLN